MAINPAFLGHGIYTQGSVLNALARFANYGGGPAATKPADQIASFVNAMHGMNIQTVWLQLFSRGNSYDTDPTSAQIRKDLIAALIHGNINWAGWGYTSGKSWSGDQSIIVGLKNDLNMSAFVIDAEPGNLIYTDPNDPKKKLPDLWTLADFNSFTSFANKLFRRDNLALTTWPVLQIQDDPAHGNPVVDLMKAAAPQVCLFAPQAYWMTYPTDVHYQTLNYSEKDYPRNDPVSFVRLTIRSWIDAGITNPIVISGQAYWGESNSTPESVMTPKVARFAQNFQDWNKILGFNWYHAGGVSADTDDSMSDQMISDIKAAHLGAKPYKTP